MTKKLQTNICDEHRYKSPQENETKFNSTLKGSNTMSKWDIPYGWKAASVYTNQLVWHTTLTEQRVKFTATIVNTALCPEAFIKRADLMVSVLSTHTHSGQWNFCWWWVSIKVTVVHACQCRRHKKFGFNPWVGKIPWRGAQQPTTVFLPGESRGQRTLVGSSP